MRLLLCLLLVLGTSACGPVKEAPPPAVPATTVVEVPVKVYVPIDKKYTKRCAWVADGAIDDIFEVARGRKACLERYEINHDAIDRIQGTPVPEEHP